MRGARGVLILATGGTIDSIYGRHGHIDIGPPAATWLQTVAGLGGTFAVEPVTAKDSRDLTDADRQLLVDRIQSSGETAIVVTHGTDTLTQTASYLNAHPELPPAVTVVLTGALQPACMRDSDASFNLGGALIAAQLLPPGVYVVMSGRTFRAGEVVKDRAAGRFVPLEPARADNGDDRAGKTPQDRPRS